MKKLAIFAAIAVAAMSANAFQATVKDVDITSLIGSAALNIDFAHWVSIVPAPLSECGSNYWIDVKDTGLFSIVLSKKMVGSKISFVAVDTSGKKSIMGGGSTPCRMVTVW